MAAEYLFTFFLSLLPISELRGAIPFALSQGVSWPLSLLIALVGNILVIPLVYFFLTFVHRALLPIHCYQRFFDSVVARTRRRITRRYEQHERWALFLFVAVPLPVTGAYTGTLAAWFLGVPFRKSFHFLALGVVAAGAIVTIIALSGIALFGIVIP